MAEVVAELGSNCISGFWRNAETKSPEQPRFMGETTMTVVIRTFSAYSDDGREFRLRELETEIDHTDSREGRLVHQPRHFRTDDEMRSMEAEQIAPGTYRF